MICSGGAAQPSRGITTTPQRWAIAPGVGGTSLGKLLSTALLNDGKFAKIKGSNYKVVRRKPKRAYKGRKKYKMHETGVKRPKAPFMWYMAAKRAEVMAANPEMKPTLIAIEIGKNWRNLPEADRAPFVAQGQVDKDRYAREMADKPKPSPSEVAAAAVDDDDDDDDDDEPPRRTTRGRR